MKYRKKPVVIEAAQWFKNGDHPHDYDQDHNGFENGNSRIITGQERKNLGWEGDVVRYYRRPDVAGSEKCKYCGQTMHFHGWIDTLEGGHIVCPGDWIITGVKGEHYPCKPDIFKKTYEPVETAPQSSDAANKPATGFEVAARPLIRWMYTNVHPHHTAVVTAMGAELLEGKLSVRDPLWNDREDER